MVRPLVRCPATAAARADPLDRHGDWSHVDQRPEAGLLPWFGGGV